jgi:hypothetical protein
MELSRLQAPNSEEAFMITKHRPHSTRLGAAFAFAASVALVMSTAAPASAATVPVYDSMPSPLPGNYTSLGFQAEQTAEFGDQVTLAGTNRNLESVSIGFSSWACETGAWQNVGEEACTTTPGATFNHPITVNIYGINGSDATLPGTLLASVSKVVAVPYRPSSDPTNCQSGTQWFDGTTCFNGLAFVESFDFSSQDVVLPDDVIVTVAFNTHTYGEAPIGTVGPYDSLNVGLSQTAPAAGTEDGSRVFWNTGNAGFYDDGGATGVLREAVDSPELGPFGSLLMTINASAPSPELADTGVDSAAMTTGVWIAGGVLVAGAALFGFAAYRKRRIANR